MTFTKKEADGTWFPEAPANSDQINAAELATNLHFPVIYKHFLESSNGGSGDIPVEPGWIEFWSTDELQSLNDEYAVSAYLSRMLAIGTSGGGEIFVVETTSTDWPVFIVRAEWIRESTLKPVASSFEGLMKMLGTSWTQVEWIEKSWKHSLE